jgi:hypothetical protein
MVESQAFGSGIGDGTRVAQVKAEALIGAH